MEEMESTSNAESTNVMDNNEKKVDPSPVETIVHSALDSDRDTQLHEVVEESQSESVPVLKRFMKSAKDKYDSIPDAWGQLRTNSDKRKDTTSESSDPSS